jgi:hypothetical protein
MELISIAIRAPVLRVKSALASVQPQCYLAALSTMGQLRGKRSCADRNGLFFVVQKRPPYHDLLSFVTGDGKVFCDFPA